MPEENSGGGEQSAPLAQLAGIVVRVPELPERPHPTEDILLEELRDAVQRGSGVMGRLLGRGADPSYLESAKKALARSRRRAEQLEAWPSELCACIAEAWIQAGSPGWPGLTKRMQERLERERVEIDAHLAELERRHEELRRELEDSQVSSSERRKRMTRRLLALEDRAEVLEAAVEALRKKDLPTALEQLHRLPPGVRDKMPRQKLNDLGPWAAALLAEVVEQQKNLELERARVDTSEVRTARQSATEDNVVLEQAAAVQSKRRRREPHRQFLKPVAGGPWPG